MVGSLPPAERGGDMQVVICGEPRAGWVAMVAVSTGDLGIQVFAGGRFPTLRRAVESLEATLETETGEGFPYHEIDPRHGNAQGD